jgi:peptide/nickel transport system ATP-binding protein/oligopeptide transport system ATP-binding protein
MSEPLLVANHLKKTFSNGVRAVDDVSFTIGVGETVGIVGESGCGKSTTARLVLRLTEADSGELRFAGQDLRALRGAALRKVRAKLQLVPQNPRGAFDPRMAIADSIALNLTVHGLHRREARARAAELLDRVGVDPRHGLKRQHELSGGQLQRAAIARALATDPHVVVCDEPVSALDKSVQAQVLNLLADLQRDTGVAYLFISHDLSVVEHISDRVLVMYLGRVVEQGSASDVWRSPAHPYTTALLSATPERMASRATLKGEPPSPVNPPSGCGFRTRCPLALDICARARPSFIEVADAHQAACVRAAQSSLERDQHAVSAGSPDAQGEACS